MLLLGEVCVHYLHTEHFEVSGLHPRATHFLVAYVQSPRRFPAGAGCQAGLKLFARADHGGAADGGARIPMCCIVPPLYTGWA